MLLKTGIEDPAFLSIEDNPKYIASAYMHSKLQTGILTDEEMPPNKYYSEEATVYNLDEFLS